MSDKPLPKRVDDFMQEIDKFLRENSDWSFSARYFFKEWIKPYVMKLISNE